VVSTQLPLHDVGVAAAHPSVHPPPEQSGVAPEHCVEQLPHVCVVPRSASQPSFGFDEQWPYPVAHADAGTTQAPMSHVTPVPLTCGSAVQSWPHAPQFFGSPATLVSHPFDGLSSQSACPVGHAPPSREPASNGAESGEPPSKGERLPAS
jgi:hypothetical protein